MSSYTLSSVPEHVEQELQRRAQEERKDISLVIVESLERGLGLRVACHADLDFLIGSWEEDPAFDAAVASFEQIDEDQWR